MTTAEHEKRYVEQTLLNARLYDPENPRGREQRRAIREHNFPIIKQVGQYLSGQPWELGKLYQIALPGLWCNETQPPSDRDEKRFFLRWQVDHTLGFYGWSLHVYDQATGKEAARRSWHSLEREQAVFVISGSSTEMGYEGNGFGSGLLAVSDYFLTAVLHHLEYWPLPEVKTVVGKIILAVIRDQAVPSGHQMSNQEKQQIEELKGAVVGTKRQLWTTTRTAALLPNYTQSFQEMKRLLGFLPAFIDEDAFFARYECRAYGHMPGAEFLLKLNTR